MEDQLSKSTSIFGIRLWVLIGIAVGVAFVFFLFLISLCYISKRNSSKSKRKTQFQSQAASTNTAIIPVLSKEIQEITVANSSQNTHFHHHEPQQPDLVNGPGRIVGNENNKLKAGSGEERLQIELVGKDKFGGSGSGSSSSAARNLGDHQVPLVVPEVSHLGWGRWYTLRELEDATNGFSDQNVIGEGGYGIVYYGVLDDNTQIAVKNLLNNK